MIDFARIVGFDWDDGNSRKNSDRHSVTQLEAEEVFVDERMVVLDDISHSQTESRYQVLGATSEGRRLHVSFTLRQDRTLIRVISARDMNRKERARYEQAP
jgi:uncharacterized DUF497 family protein